MAGKALEMASREYNSGSGVAVKSKNVTVDDTTSGLDWLGSSGSIGLLLSSSLVSNGRFIRYLRSASETMAFPDKSNSSNLGLGRGDGGPSNRFDAKQSALSDGNDGSI